MNKKYLLLFCVIILINAIYNAVYQLHYDEAYYWAFSQHLSLSYYDHPPMLAYMIKLCSLLGHSEFLVRLPALVCGIITVITMVKLAQCMWDNKIANITLLLALCSPLIEAIFFIVTPDSPLLMFWSLTLYCLYQWIFNNKNKYAYLAGLFAGCGLLSKYMMILIFPGLFLFLILSQSYRGLLFKKELYLASIIALAAFMPVIYWNYNHDWISFKFQLHHGVDLSQQFNAGAFFDYLGGQILISGIFIFLPLLFFIVRYYKVIVADDKLSFLFWPFAFILIFFGYRALFQHMEANWPAVAYVSGIILLAYWVGKLNIKWIRYASAILITIVLIVTKAPLYFVPTVLHNKQEIQIVNAFYGSKELISQVRPYIKSNNILLACDYGNASRAWFYLSANEVYVLDDFKFAHMYQYWNNQLSKQIKSAIYICDNNDANALDNLQKYFKSISLLHIAKYDNKVGDRYLYIYRATN